MSLAHSAQGKGTPLLLVHGFPMNRSVWSAFAKLLATHFETYTIDLPGFGESASTPAP
ncbi:MAG: alpha/beta hydrolase, partial [Bacteroidia bacterium]|nr:alpha/beta hydrolase [Bacteroidia bacterium]